MSMAKYVARRSVEILILMFIISTLTFLLFRLMPSDPVGIQIDPYRTPEEVAKMRVLWGLDKSIPEQYIIFVRNLLHGEFGTSYYWGKDVYDIIREKLPATVLLFTTMTALSFSIGMYMGRIIAWRRGGKLEYSSTVVGMFLFSMPGFWICLLAVWLFSYKLGAFPLGGMKTTALWTSSANTSIIVKALDIGYHMFLPLTVGVLISFSGPMLMMKNVMLETLGEDYITTARAKGVSEKVVRDHHAARNVMLPMVTVITLSLVSSIGGSMIVETIFNWPGLGAEFLKAAMNYDYPVAQGAFIIMAALLLVTLLITEVMYAYLDPRIRY
ncbi:MAG: ABC transporter permease [Theionarchaea archaeon]|nr:ABC transporter permease [Theionarchaea archaeon]